MRRPAIMGCICPRPRKIVTAAAGGAWGEVGVELSHKVKLKARPSSQHCLGKPELRIRHRTLGDEKRGFQPPQTCIVSAST